MSADIRDDRQRLLDLVRQQRMELHADGLITDDEYAKLASVPGSPLRLESYDEMRAEIARLRAPSPASAAPEREWSSEQFREARQMRVDLDTLFFLGPKDDEITLKWCAAIARVSPHFAPRPKVRLPDWGGGELTNSALGYRKALEDVRSALRSAGIEIEGEQP